MVWTRKSKKVSKKILVVFSMNFDDIFNENHFFLSPSQWSDQSKLQLTSGSILYHQKTCSCDLRRNVFFLATKIPQEIEILTGFEDPELFSASRFKFSNSVSFFVETNHRCTAPPKVGGGH